MMPAFRNQQSAIRNPKGAVIVAHPDDETLWCGGFLLRHPDWHWTVLTLCRAGDPDRAPKFHHAMSRFGAVGVMGDLDDGPEQKPLALELLRREITRLLPSNQFDLILTHAPNGEYTRHRRHEECCRAVCAMWANRLLEAAEVKCFAYEDGRRAYLPRARTDADEHLELSGEELATKRKIITEIYGFAEDCWEARAVTPTEAFWSFTRPEDATKFIADSEVSSQ